ncbi:hypothetical protein P691DRAFT_806879 [Macrolepiota fuliginosa MF-IS2]|uniref:Copper transport protein n=1 Tax=Macrolepiota fuliginosa MF-IS2 TaxID=1400762 RepID=A0A9P6C7D5_9AGAR|nr:hypothetical protein P691DRAFT_806879 [Macrolepiota fuliginosa MF-IS2]
MSSAFEAQWAQRALRTQTLTPPTLEKLQLSVASSEESTKKQRPLPLRTIPPFIARIDIPRGILYGFKRLLGFILMLAVMTFHAGYFISILAGLGLGEILFGRIGARAAEANH